MMDNNNWRRGRGGNNNNNCHYYKGEFQNNTRSNYRKPPPVVGSWQNTVPSWEKEFCYVIGGIPWRKLLDTKKYIHLYDNVLQWNDSAGEEAFKDAKTRFHAKKNRVPCEISLPDPDAYIDEIDWNSEIDPELLLDLEREPDIEDEAKVHTVGHTLLLNQTVPCTGWGDDEEDEKKDTYFPPATGWGIDEEDKKNDAYLAPAAVENLENSWEHGCGESNNRASVELGWGDSWNDSYGWNQWENKFEDTENWRNKEKDGNWGTQDGNNRWTGESAGWNMSRYKTSRYHGDEYQRDRGWKNGRGKRRVSFDYYARPTMEKKPTSTQWSAMKSCQPLNHGSRIAADHWNWEKPVL